MCAAFPVHHGVHHGLQGLLLIVTALLLSRLPNRVSLFLALMVAYGLGNIANDDWLEQIAERGWTSWAIPSSLEPRATWTWLAVLLATPVIWLLWFRRRERLLASCRQENTAGNRAPNRNRTIAAIHHRRLHPTVAAFCPFEPWPTSFRRD